ncbi:MAG: hypothetical protein EBR01_13870, partial [Proteobacteria bacterium]|nr:hypothetical protein [Pseudomonadota bacterium]
PMNSTSNDVGPWGSDTFLYSWNNEVGPLGSPVILTSLTNELGPGRRLLPSGGSGSRGGGDLP